MLDCISSVYKELSVYQPDTPHQCFVSNCAYAQYPNAWTVIQYTE